MQKVAHLRLVLMSATGDHSLVTELEFRIASN